MLQAPAYQPGSGISIEYMQNVAERPGSQNAIGINERKVVTPRRLSPDIAASSEPHILARVNERQPRIHFRKLRQRGADSWGGTIDDDDELAKLGLFEHRTQRGPEYWPR